MVKIIGNELRVGNVIEHKKGLWEVLKTIHTKPGKGGAYVQAEMKEIIKKTKLNERFRSNENIEKAVLDEEIYQYLYPENDSIVVMDLSTYEQHSIDKSLLGDQIVYLQDEMQITVLSYDAEIIKAKVPKHVILLIQDAEAVIKGQTASSSYKPATLENGLIIMVPPFIKAGDKVVVNTEDNSYVERAK